MEDENNQVEETVKKTAKSVARKAGRSLRVILRPILPWIILIAVIIIFLVSALYLLDEDLFKDDGNPKKAQTAYRDHVNTSSIDKDGNITYDKTYKELWDELKKQGNNAVEYLDTPEELAKLIAAATVTEYPDMRPEKEIEEDIDWEEYLKEDCKKAQGGVKLKRKDKDNNEYYLTYVSPTKFNELVNNFNKEPTSANQQEAMKHFTLKKVRSSTGVGSGNLPSDLRNLQAKDMKEKATIANNHSSMDDPEGAEARQYVFDTLAALAIAAHEKFPMKVSLVIMQCINESGWVSQDSSLVQDNNNILGLNDWGDGALTSPDTIWYQKGQRTVNETMTHIGGSTVDPAKSFDNLYECIEDYMGQFIYHHPASEFGDYDDMNNYQSYLRGYTEGDGVTDVWERYKGWIEYYDLEKYDKMTLADLGYDTNLKSTGESSGGYSSGGYSSKGQEIADTARQYVGKIPYVWGGESLETGADCSGFVWAILTKCGVYSGPRITAAAFANKGTEVSSLSQAVAGDVIVTQGHIAFYDGKGKIIEAASEEAGLIDSRSATEMTNDPEFLGIRRFTNDVSPSLGSGNWSFNETGTTLENEGYTREYKSSTGFTYKEFKQGWGSWGGQSYWGETMASAGCGPTTVAILASGLQPSLNYTPAETGKQMNDRYGETGPDVLNAYIKTLGMPGTLKYYPSADDILGALKTGHVMIGSVGIPTGLAGSTAGHIISIVDINENNEVFVLTSNTPGAVTDSGWYSVDTILKSCWYIITIDTGRIGVASADPASGSSEQYTYIAQVATWSERIDKLESNDSEVETYDRSTAPRMTIKNVEYQKLTGKYAMPFNYIWIMLIMTQSKDFTLDLADLMFNSKFIVTVYDNYTETTNIQEENYTKEWNTEYKGTYHYAIQYEDRSLEQGSGSIDDVLISNKFFRKYTKINRTNTIEQSLTLADTWCVKYEEESTYTSINTPTTHPEETGILDTEWEKMEPSNLDQTIDKEKRKMKQDEVKAEVRAAVDASGKQILGEKRNGWTSEETIHTKRITDSTRVITDILVKQTHRTSPGEYTEKMDEETAPNFVSLLQNDYNAKTNVTSAPDWLFEGLESNKDTAEMVDLTKYMLYKTTGRDYGVTTFDFATYDPRGFKNTSAGQNGGIQLSLINPTLSKEDFVAALNDFSASISGNLKANFDANFLPYASQIYDVSVQNNLNPELVIITAYAEGGFRETGGSYNYWGIGVPNGATSGSSYSSLADGVRAYASALAKYQPGGEWASTITQMCEERRAAGCDPLGYGMPGTFSGMQSIYSDLGKHEYGSSGAGGYYYMDPDRAGVTKIYSTHQEFVEKCYNVDGEHAEGTRVTTWENGQYTAWQVETKYKIWNEIFGKYGNISTSGGEFLETAKKVWQEVCDKIEYYTDARIKYIPVTGNYIDCSSYVSWVLYEYGYTEFAGAQKTTGDFINTNWNAKYGWTEIDVAGGENPYDKLQPGDLLVRHGGNLHHITLVVEKKQGRIYCYDCGVKRNSDREDDYMDGDIGAWIGANGKPVDRSFMLTGSSPGKIIRVTPVR